MVALTSESIRNLILCILVTSAVVSKREEYAQMAQTINADKNSPWSASLIVGIDYDNEVGLVKMASGTFITDTLPEGAAKPRPRQLQTVQVSNGKLMSAYPASLNLRTKYVRCRSAAMIRNQGACSSCWAVAAMTSISDRYCMAKSQPGKTQERFFSFQDSLECCSTCTGTAGKPCDGGYIYQVFLFAKTDGVVTGDSYGSNNLCKPYFLSPSFYGSLKNPTCASQCAITAATALNTSGRQYANDKLKISDFTYGKGEAQMIQALNEGGSIAATIKVYSDLYLYKSGVYAKASGVYLGGHAIKVIGYGVDSGVKYWLAANSWGTSWGEQGFFRLKRGTDESTIESSYFFAAIV